MATPAPLLRPPIPGSGRPQATSKVPRLGLAIPPSPNQRPVNSSAAPPVTNDSGVMSGSSASTAVPSRPAPPKLSLATPMGTKHTPEETPHARRRGPPLTLQGVSANSSDDSAHSRANSFGASTNPAGSVSTHSEMSALNYPDIMGGRNDPASAAGSLYSSSSLHSGGEGMVQDGSSQGLEVDLEKLSLEKGRPLDVQDLDDMGWKAAKRDGRIVELGSLGEGAGGAVTRCQLKDGRTVFALKVR